MMSGLTVDHLPSVRDGSLFQILNSRKVELLVSVNCSRKLYRREITFPKFGTINIHNSDLPKYRGLMPILHAIRNGDKKSEISVHFINENFDEGDIIAK